MGSGAEDYDAVVAPTGRHGFREEVASNLKMKNEEGGSNDQWTGRKKMNDEG